MDVAEQVPTATAVYYLWEDVIATVSMAFAGGVDLYGSSANKKAIIRAEYNRCRNYDEQAPAGKYFARISVRRDVSE